MSRVEVLKGKNFTREQQEKIYEAICKSCKETYLVSRGCQMTRDCRYCSLHIEMGAYEAVMK
jgi:hypothetical protein